MRRLDRLWARVGVGEPVVVALERERLALPLAMHHLELLGEDVHPLAHGREREAVALVLRPVPPRAHPDLDPPAGDVVDRDGGFGQYGRMPEGRRRYERAEAKGRRDGGEAGKRGPGVERAALVRAHDRAVVIGAKQRLVPVLLARARERAPVLPGHALLTLDHHAEPHAEELCLGALSWVRANDAMAESPEPGRDRSARRALGRGRLPRGPRRRRGWRARGGRRDPVPRHPAPWRREQLGLRRRHRSRRWRLGAGTAGGDSAIRGSRARPQGLQHLRVHRCAEDLAADLQERGRAVRERAPRALPRTA